MKGRVELNRVRIRPNKPLNTPIFCPARVLRDGVWFPASSMEKVNAEGKLKMDIRINSVNVRTYVAPENIECLHDDWICHRCGRINGKDYSNCNGCGKGKS